MHGGNHWCDDLPVALIGGGGGVLKTDQHVQFEFFPNDRPMRDLYYTIMNEYFGLGVADFGTNTKAYQRRPSSASCWRRLGWKLESGRSLVAISRSSFGAFAIRPRRRIGWTPPGDARPSARAR